MFEGDVIEDLSGAVAALLSAPLDLATNAEKGHLLRTVSQAQDLLDGVKAQALASFEQSGGPSDDGAPTLKSWAQRHLRLDAREAGKLAKAGRTLAALPQVRDSLHAGRIRLAHVHEFSSGLTKAGAETIGFGEEFLVTVAEAHEPSALRDEIRGWIDAIHPDSLDRDYINGMDKRDLKVSRVADGFAVNGFLDIPTGAKLKALLGSLGAPDGREDDRRPSERRLANLDALLESVLTSGLPTRNGVRPQLSVTVDLDRLQGVPGAEPARLEHWGIIGDQLLGYLLCDSEVTGILTNGHTDEHGLPQASVLNVGRSQRLATPAQRTAIRHRQGGHCANPGCSNTVLEIHHLDWWVRDLGVTDLDKLVGLCSRCHHLVHAGRLHAHANDDGTTAFTLIGGTRVTDNRRHSRHLARQRLRQLRHILATAGDGSADTPSRDDVLADDVLADTGTGAGVTVQPEPSSAAAVAVDQPTVTRSATSRRAATTPPSRKISGPDTRQDPSRPPPRRSS